MTHDHCVPSFPDNPLFTNEKMPFSVTGSTNPTWDLNFPFLIFVCLFLAEVFASGQSWFLLKSSEDKLVSLGLHTG